MALIDKLSQIRPDAVRENNFNDFVIDADVLRDNPQLVFRKIMFESVKNINSAKTYNSYGIVVFEFQTRNPATSVNKIRKSATDTTTVFNEYLVLPLDGASVSLDTYLTTALDIYKATTLLRCGSEQNLLIPIGSFVKIEFDNNLRENPTIVNIYGEIPPLLSENDKALAIQVYRKLGCEDNSSIKTNSDGINGDKSTPVANDQAPTPAMSTTVCNDIKKRIEDLGGFTSDETNEEDSGAGTCGDIDNSLTTPAGCGTVEATGFDAKKPIKIKISELPGFPGKYLQSSPVNAYAAFLRMQAAAKSDGVDFFLNSAFRTKKKQEQLYAKYQEGLLLKKTGAAPPGYKFQPLTAEPGTSRHQLGLAVDFRLAANPKIFPWLQANAEKYGFFVLKNRNGKILEDWHWSYKIGSDPSRA